MIALFFVIISLAMYFKCSSSARLFDVFLVHGGLGATASRFHTKRLFSLHAMHRWCGVPVLSVEGLYANISAPERIV